MKRILLVFLTLLTAFTAQAQFPQWTWAHSVGGRQNGDSPSQMCQDNQHNIYVSGDFSGTQSFGTQSLTATGVNDGFLTKFDENGVFQWAVNLGGTSTLVQPYGLTVDDAGNIYLTGSFTYALNLNGSTVFSTGSKDVFLVKYNSNGILLWGRTFGSNLNDEATSISYYNNTLFMCGTYTQAFTNGGVSFPAPNGTNEDIFVAKFDTAGICQQAVTAGGSQVDHVYGISASANAVYITGAFAGQATFGTTPISAVGTAPDFYLARYQPSGLALDWVVRAGNISNDQGNSVSQDAAGNAYVAGYFLRTVNFGNSVILVEQSGYGDGFILKYNTAGLCQWGHKVSGVQNDQALSITTDPLGGSIVTGYFGATALLSGSLGNITLASTGGIDMYIAKYSTNGILRWAVKAGSTSDDRGKAALAGTNGDFYFAGNYTGTSTFGAAGSLTAPSGLNGCVIGRLNGGTVGLNEPLADDAFDVFPNPSSTSFNIKLNKDDEITAVDVYSIEGRLVTSEIYSIPVKHVSIDVNNLPKGSYLLSVQTKKGLATRIVSVQ